MERYCENVLAVAKYFSDHPKVLRIKYQGLPTDPDFCHGANIFEGTAGVPSEPLVLNAIHRSWPGLGGIMVDCGRFDWGAGKHPFVPYSRYVLWRSTVGDDKTRAFFWGTVSNPSLKVVAKFEQEKKNDT